MFMLPMLRITFRAIVCTLIACTLINVATPAFAEEPKLDNALAVVDTAGNPPAKPGAESASGAIATPLIVTLSNANEIAPPSFTNDVVPLLTRLGCNQGACHGKNEGRNGFKLSLRGYAPEWDFERLARESRSRRVNLAYPEQSLLLRKALGESPHGGGKLLAADSPEHRLLLDWIRAGASGPTGKEPRVDKLELSPGGLTLKPEQQQQLAVHATYSDGTRRDVTWLTQFFTNDATVLDVTPAGMMRAVRHGETAVRAHFHGQVAIAIATIPYDQPIDAGQISQRNNFIDEHVFSKLAALRIPPSGLTSDEQFVRRVYLDAIGTLPTADEVRAFTADTAADKRVKLIDALLERPEYADYRTLQLGDLLQNRRERDHDVRGTKEVRSMHAWLRDQVAKNRPWNELARDVLTATGNTTEHPEIGYFVVTVGEQQDADKSEVVASVAQAFLGTRIGCAQCHNHPLEKYTQDDYYHFAAYFSSLKLKREDSKKGATQLSIAPLKDGRKKVGVHQPRTGKFMEPQSLDGAPCELQPNDDPRAKLATWMIDPKNDAFAGAMVNRIWRHYLGVGLVEPVDDLRASNPPSNPELWKALVGEFVSHNYDMKHLTRVILNSRAYQLSSATVPANVVVQPTDDAKTAGNAGPSNSTDTRFYSHYYARRMPAEVLLDAICQTTGRPETFSGFPEGVRSIQLPEPGLDSYFLSQFGRSDRVTACACERRGEVTIPQLLQLQNGEGLNRKIAHGEGYLARLMKAKTENQPEAASGSANQQIVQELFITTFARAPTSDEYSKIENALSGANAGTGENRDDVLRDLFWALINSKEFVFNR